MNLDVFRQNKSFFLFFIGFFSVFFIAQRSMAQKTHTVFYEGTEHELHVYRVYGRTPGKTLLLIGGIQGDEPGGFLAADFYADLSLEKGNLIVVPRANFPSILKQRRDINEDMNRKFADNTNTDYEARVVKVLKQLIHESDCLLNLHEGSGIYSPQWKTSMINPARFGQSIIADTDIFEDKNRGIKIDLKNMAERVIKKLNSHIKNQKYLFHFNNHRTRAKNSIHKEQRKSATYYALYTCEIPAFGIESTKTLPLEQKVRQPVYAINEFMKLLDIVPESPGVDLKKPALQYMVLSVNNALPIVIKNMQHLEISRGDTIEIIDIKANYKRGLSADVLGFGSRFNDMHKKIVITEQTRISIKKDFYPCGSVFLDFRSPGKGSTEKGLIVKKSPDLKKSFSSVMYRVNINGKRYIIKNNDHIELCRGDKFEIEDAVADGLDPSELVVNLKGFIGNPRNNTGEDRGYPIDTSTDVLMKRYSLNKKGKHYKVITTLRNKQIGRFYIDFK